MEKRTALISTWKELNKSITIVRSEWNDMMHVIYEDNYHGKEVTFQHHYIQPEDLPFVLRNLGIPLNDALTHI